MHDVYIVYTQPRQNPKKLLRISAVEEPGQLITSLEITDST